MVKPFLTLDNGIPISGWIMGADESLLDLLPFLEALRYVHDLRSILASRNV